MIRRLYFDLTGLPPDPDDVDAFVSDPDPFAYEKLIDRLIESVHYGERWPATGWTWPTTRTPTVTTKTSRARTPGRTGTTSSGRSMATSPAPLRGGAAGR